MLSFFLRADWASEARRHGELSDRLNTTFRPQGYFLHVEVLQQQQDINLSLKALTEAAGAFLQGLPDPQPDVPFVLVVGDHDPFCGDLELLLAIYGRDWEAMVGARPPLWQQDRKAAGFFGIGKGERPYNTRFSAVAAIGGSRPWYDPNGTQWLVFDNPHGRVRLPDGLLPVDHRFQALEASRWGWSPPRPGP